MASNICQARLGGAAKHDLVRAWVHIHDAADVDKVNAAWDLWMDGAGRLPAGPHCLLIVYHWARTNSLHPPPWPDLDIPRICCHLLYR